MCMRRAARASFKTGGGAIKNASHEVALKTFLSNAVDSFFIIILSLLSRELRKPPWLCVGRG